VAEEHPLKVKQESLVYRDATDMMDHLVKLDLSETLVTLVKLVCLVKKENLVFQDYQDCQDLREMKDDQVYLVELVFLVHQAKLANQDLKVSQDCRENPVNLDFLDLMDPLDLKETEDLLEHLVWMLKPSLSLALRELEVQVDLLENKVSQVSLEEMVQVDDPDKRVNKVSLVWKVLPVFLVIVVNQDLKVL